MTATSDVRGRVSIELPSPRLFGNQTVTAALDLSPELEPLLQAAGADKELVSSLEQAIASVRAVLHYRTTSLAASIPTGVLVMDLDRGGNPIPEDDTAAGIENALSQSGFHILPIPSNRSICGIDMPDLVTILRNNFGSKIQRAIVGHARISGFEHTDGNYVVKVTGHIEVADLESGKVLGSMKSPGHSVNGSPNGDIFVTDSHRTKNGPAPLNNRVGKFTRDGTVVKEGGQKGSGPGELGEPAPDLDRGPAADARVDRAEGRPVEERVVDIGFSIVERGTELGFDPAERQFVGRREARRG